MQTRRTMRVVAVAVAVAASSSSASLFESLAEDAPRHALLRREAAWASRLERKMACVASGRGALYLYHMRKAAGTTLRGALQRAAAARRCAYYETEGLAIDAAFLGVRSAITVVGLRDPVARALSLYWYEHVGWHDGVKHEPEKVRPLADWVDEWSDGSAWKSAFAKANPSNVYIEIANYYTKALTGWNRRGAGEALGSDALEAAKRALERFDVVFVVERATRANHTALLAAALGLPGLALPETLKGDGAAKARLAPRLAPDAAAVARVLEARNGRDRALYDFALQLDDARVAARRAGRAPSPRGDGPCEAASFPRAKTGIFRPPGHKH